jgi:hypothetical protein
MTGRNEAKSDLARADVVGRGGRGFSLLDGSAQRRAVARWWRGEPSGPAWSTDG